MVERRKMVVGIGGTLRPNSSTEKAVRAVLEAASVNGAEVRMFAGLDIDFPMYSPSSGAQPAGAASMIDAIRSAHAVVIGSPGYHGGISGLVKNALDYTEEMAGDPSPYFSNKAVGCIATGAGWQGANSTLHALRSVVHALRGWPTPLGIALNSKEALFDANGLAIHGEVDAQLKVMAAQLLEQ
ncbi:MAG: FMN reductase [Sphingomonas sp. 28-62-20]|nr:MAG: FMN reductase [Sphingomonas sp. 28-62-20]